MSVRSHFFAYLSRMKFIQRWGLMRNTCPENIQEHSLQVALVAHCLALVRNQVLGGAVDAQRVMALALFHEVGEVITGDLASPIKYFNPEIKTAYGRIEEVANQRLLGMVPAPLREQYRTLLFPEAADAECLRLVKAADKLCAYLKCLEELKAGNQEFSQARMAIERDLERLAVPEVAYFMEQFAPSFSLTLDELN
ncbi:MAG: 5'-deoxynucleotidase [Candidatus Latescibacteria bacterium]|nr:5'-deoxynucleotidase [Candidatus Latescibacterota bacterium]